MSDDKRSKLFLSQEELVASLPKVPLSAEQQKATDEANSRNRARLFAFLEEAKHILSDEAYPDMLPVLGDLADPDQGLYDRLRNAYYDAGTPRVTPKTAPS